MATEGVAAAVLRFAIVAGLLLSACPAGADDRYGEALRAYRDADYPRTIEVLSPEHPKSAGDESLLGWAFLKSGHAGEARERFERSLALDPGASDSHCGLGYVSLRLERPGPALESFDAGIARDGRNVDCLLGRAQALETLDRPAQALETYRAVLSIDPANGVAAEKTNALSRRAVEDDGTEKVEYFARGKYFWVGTGSGPPEPVFVKGVNLGFALPGKFPTGFPEGEEAYLEWFARIREMNANLIRVYTILPPAFYRAVKTFNRGKPRGERLFVIQGIWTELPERSDFREPAYFREVKNEIADAVDAIHGNAAIPRRRGHAHGVYAADISDSVLGFIFGREWEPPEVVAFNQRAAATRFAGKHLSIADANPMEAWLTEMLDSLVAHEADRYGTTRPVAWMNWPPLDPLIHPAEATLREELELRRRAGEAVPDVAMSEAWDDDAVSIDETKVRARPEFRGGIFSSYHVYPYYPDFLRNEEKYGKRTFPEGSSRYYNYLVDLRNHYRDIPLLISEYGLPTSRGIARFHPEGLNHGGHDEAEQAEGLKRLTLSIRQAGCAGAVVFSWIDEWVKTSWMARGMEERGELWFNAQDPEESYGLIAVLPAGPERLAGDPSSWERSTLLYARRTESPLASLGDGHDGARHIRRLAADADAGYLYLRLDLSGPIDWESAAYAIAMNTLGAETGSRRLPFDLDWTSPIGFQYLVLLHGGSGRLLIHAPYNRTGFDPKLRRIPGMSGYREREDFRSPADDSGRFTELVTIHRRRFARDGTVFPERVYNASALRHGTLPEDTLADFHHDEEHHSLEIRLPWNLLNVSDPSSLQVIAARGERRTTEGFRILALSYKPRGRDDSAAAGLPAGPKVTDMVPRDPKDIAVYRWKGWESPEYAMRPKKSYYAMKELFGRMGDPEVRIHLPAGFEFASVVRNHYGSPGEFLDLYRAQRGSAADPYGAAMANLARGLAGRIPFFLLEARSAFAEASRFSPNERERELSRLGAGYVDRLLSGGSGDGSGGTQALERIRIRKANAPSGDFRRVVIGRSAIRLPRGARVATQVDRVTRDWLSARNVDAAPRDLRKETIVPWHEGLKILELLDSEGAGAVSPVWGTTARKFGDGWYAPDADGIFRFPISEDKVYNYPTNILLDDRTVVMNDTHGLNAIAWGASGADLAVGCGDHEGKIEAAYYLAEKGVDVYLPTDRFLGALMGTDTPGTILGSAPVRKTEDGAVIGDQPVSLDPDEAVVVSTSDGGYPLQYYDTPHRYFSELQRYLGRPMKIVPVEVRTYGQGAVVVREARRIGARVIGIRVWGKEEHDAVAGWLAEDPGRRALLFHSAVYPEGYRLFFEFPRQTSFGDIHVALE